MKNDQRPTATLLDELASNYFGDEWAIPVSHFSKVNQRTLQRVRQAARRGDDHAAARGVLAALEEALPDFQQRLEAIRGGNLK